MPEPMTREQAIEIYLDSLKKMATPEMGYAHLTGNADWAVGFRRIPDYMHDALAKWVLFGEIPGKFLSAVLEGDLFGAARYADDTNRHMLYEYALVLHNYVPAQSNGPGVLKTWKGLFPA